jgi:hypothetical protein
MTRFARAAEKERTMKIRNLTIIILLVFLPGFSVARAGDTVKKVSGKEKTANSLIQSGAPSAERVQPHAVETDRDASKAGPTAGEQIYWQVMGGGGGLSAAGGYQINGTLGQPIAGWTSTASHSIHQGYWQNFMATGDCCELPGDFNGDLELNVGDCMYLIYYLFRFGPPPPCLNEADINVDCMVDLADIVWMINYIFKNGPAPECGCME